MEKINIKKLIPLWIVIGTIIILVAISNNQDPAQIIKNIKQVQRVNFVEVKPDLQNFLISSRGFVQARKIAKIGTNINGKVEVIRDIFLEGNYVKKGDVLAEINPIKYKYELSRAKYELEKAKEGLMREMINQKIATKNLNEMRIKGNDYAMHKPQIKTAKAALEASKSMLEQAKFNLEQTKIKAPCDGIIKETDIYINKAANQSAIFGTIVNTETLYIKLPIKQSELSLIKDKYPISITLKQEQGKSIKASIISKPKIIDTNSRMVYMIAKINSNKENIIIGEFLTASIPSKKIAKSFAIPQNLVKNKKIRVITEAKTLKIIQIEQIYYMDQDFVYAKIDSDKPLKIISNYIENEQEGMKLRYNLENEEETINIETEKVNNA